MEWYALCEYKGKGKNKKPYQIQASQLKPHFNSTRKESSWHDIVIML